MSTTRVELRSLITSDGELRLTLEDVAVAAPGPDEVVVRVEAAPLNPSDLGMLLGPADLATLSTGVSSGRPLTTAKIQPQFASRTAALMHILMGVPLNPHDAERKGLVHETVSGKAIDRAIEIARRLAAHTPESVAHIKRLVRNATETPLAQGLALERNLFLKLCIGYAALARMRSYEEQNITSPSRSIEVKRGA